MAISMKKYVDIESATNNIKTATEKDLIPRIFTTNELMPTQVLEFDDIYVVGQFFGFQSEEYKIAEKYFTFINKYARSPRKISFFRNYTNENGIKAFIYGKTDYSVSDFTSVTSGSLTITMNSITEEITSINLSSCTTMADVASVIQTAIREANSDASYTSATVVFNNDTLVLTAGTAGEYSIDIANGDLAELLSFRVSSEGHSADKSTIENVFENSYQQSNNFATFVFLGLTDEDEIEELATYVTVNYQSEFMMIVPVSDSNYDDIQEAVAHIEGVSLELCGATEDTGKYNFVLPMSITATTDYNKENGTVNYMYTQDDNMEVVVDNDTEAEKYDVAKVNYYGQTQKSGQKLAFYQNGVLQGKYQDQNTFVNEIWLKDALTTKYINYMMLTPNWYANKSGQAIGQGLAMDVIQRAKLNGTITTEKEISENDKSYIYNVTDDENAWRQIYQEGYYLMTKIEKKTINNQETYTFNYTLLYSKGDSIKKVEGTDILI